MCADNFLFCSWTLWAQTAHVSTHQLRHTAAAHRHTCRASPSCLTLHSGSCVPPGASRVIHLFTALLIYVRTRERYPLPSALFGCGFTAPNWSSTCYFFFFPRGNGDVLQTGARVICQRCWRATESVQVFECNVNVFCCRTTVTFSVYLGPCKICFFLLYSTISVLFCGNSDVFPPFLC